MGQLFQVFFLTMPAKITDKTLWLVLPEAIGSLSSDVFREVRQPKVDFLQTWVVNMNKRLSKSSL